MRYIEFFIIWISVSKSNARYHYKLEVGLLLIFLYCLFAISVKHTKYQCKQHWNNCISCIVQPFGIQFVSQSAISIILIPSY